jgi:hypothetical protein
MSAGDTISGLLTLLDMLGGFVRKAIRGDRTTVFREWRHRDNTLLGIAALLVIPVAALLVWLFIVI